MFETVLMIVACIICFIFGRVTASSDNTDYDEGWNEGWMNAWSQIGSCPKEED